MPKVKFQDFLTVLIFRPMRGAEHTYRYLRMNGPIRAQIVERGRDWRDDNPGQGGSIRILINDL